MNYQGAGSTTVTGLGYTIPDPYGSLWTVVDEWGNGISGFDEQVIGDGFGNTVWRFSNAVTSSGYSDQPNTPSSPAVAGETAAGLYNDRGPNHTTPTAPMSRAATSTPYFHAGFRVKSATEAAQPGLTIVASPIPRQSSFRMSYLGISDSGSGLDLLFYDTAADASFVLTTVATGLSYADWHKIDIYVEFVDGLNGDGSGNDVVTIMVDDVPVHSGTTWETYFRTWTPSTPVVAVDALMFRAAGAAATATSGNGLYFDDVVVDNGQVPPPPPSFDSLGDCISTLIGENCSGLKGRSRAECNHTQQMACFDIFGVK